MLDHPEFDIQIESMPDERRRITVQPKNAKQMPFRSSCVTSYDNKTIEAILRAKTPSHLCDEIARDEDPYYIRSHVTATLTAHIDPATLKGRRLMDFGCGAGASTVTLAQLLPHTEIVGIELDSSNLAAAQARIDFYGLTNVQLLQSPCAESIPPDIGSFAAVMLPAVFEHLLPHERKVLLPMLWDLIETDGFLFLDETPWRWFPIESHTTGLPLINYLPDKLVASIACRLSSRISKSATWDELLRGGIRGGTIAEISEAIGSPSILVAPVLNGVSNYIDLWERGYASSANEKRLNSAKRFAIPLMRLIYKLTGISPVPYLSVAFRKPPAELV
jgi:predicted O-methyltransferase YrrM